MSLILPDVIYEKGLPRLLRSQSVSRVANRTISVVETADPVWRADMVTGALARHQVRPMRNFLAQAGSGARTILFAPSFLGVPAHYIGDEDNPAVLDDGALSVADSYTITLTGVTAGLTLSQGDFVGFEKAGYRSLHMVNTDAVAAGSVIQFEAEPAVPIYITAGAVAKFKGMGLNMRLVPGTDSMTDEWAPVASFTLVEVPK